MIRKLLLLPVTVLLSLAVSGQSLFTDIQAPLMGLGFSRAAWLDIDGDLDLDLFVSGADGSTDPAARIYRNDNGTFTDTYAALPGLFYCYAEPGDFDNDGDLDILVCGTDSVGMAVTKLFRNDGGTYTELNIQLPGISEGQVAWGDLDNDGYLDILLAGSGKARILHNDAGTGFSETNVHLANVENAFCCWTDYNNDGRMDVMVGGDSGGTFVTKLYRNHEGEFSEDSAGFIGLMAARAAWGDLDHDGDPDLVLAGLDSDYDGNFFIYRNEGNSHFTRIDEYTFGVIYPSISLGDYDNDGLTDIFITGNYQGCGGTALSLLFHNTGNMTFENVSTLITGYSSGTVAWGDYNNDGWSDLLFTGLNNLDIPETVIYRNNGGSTGFSVNTPPNAPVPFSSEETGNGIILRWNRSTDGQTPASGLSYNLYIGSAPGNADVLSPASDIPSGSLRASSLGNAGPDTAWLIRDLEPGTYYWSVQAVDNAFTGSAFGPEQSFAIWPVGIETRKKEDQIVYPNPFSDRISFTGLVPDKIEVFLPDGRIAYRLAGPVSSIDLSFLDAGMYLIRIFSGGSEFSQPLYKQ